MRWCVVYCEHHVFVFTNFFLCMQKGNFRAYSRVFPLSSFGFRPDPDLYRMCVACTELVCALLLYLGNRTANHLVNFIIFGIMIGAIYTHYALGEPLEKMGGAMIGLTLVTVRIFLMGCGTSTEIKVKIG